MAVSSRRMSRHAITLITLLAIGCRSTPAAGPLPSLEQLPASVLPADARSAGAVRYVDVVVGQGAPAEDRKCAYVDYTGYLTNGERFESSRDSTSRGPGAPIGVVLGAGQVIKGWDIGFVGMRVGGQRRLFIPARLGYGTRGS